MTPRYTPDGPETFTKAGELSLTHNHLALLHGLMDRPDGTARSVEDWVAASLPYINRYERACTSAVLRRAIGTMHTSWVQRRRVGHHIQVTLLPRGRSILDLQILTRVRGFGVYRGLPKHQFGRGRRTSG